MRLRLGERVLGDRVRSPRPRGAGRAAERIDRGDFVPQLRAAVDGLPTQRGVPSLAAMVSAVVAR